MADAPSERRRFLVNAKRCAMNFAIGALCVAIPTCFYSLVGLIWYYFISQIDLGIIPPALVASLATIGPLWYGICFGDVWEGAVPIKWDVLSVYAMPLLPLALIFFSS